MVRDEARRYPEFMKIALALATVSLGLASLTFAADPPSGESLIQRSIDREGGVKSLGDAQNAVMTGTVEVVGRNLAGSFQMYQQGPKAYTVMELPGLGKIEEGFDGEVAWESNVLQGPRIKDGEEREAVKRASRISVLTDWKEFYKSAVTLGSEEVGGKPAWKVEMTPTSGTAEYFYFDRDSGLISKMTQTLPTAMGNIPVEMLLSDYRTVDGVQTPFLMTQAAMGQTMAIHIEKVTYRASIPAGRFDLPAEVKVLAAKSKVK